MARRARRPVTLEATVWCVICGAPLAADADDDPDGEGPRRPICGECTRARNFDVQLWEMDAADGELDGEIE
jgi:hypothetical protein